MKQKLADYLPVIKKLPIKQKYTKEDLLTPDFLIEKDNNIEIYYAPHNEYINPQAKLFIVGITPGFEQMSTAIKTAKTLLDQEASIDEISYECKVAGRFSGSLRHNLITLLNQLNLNQKLHLSDASELFSMHDNLLHTCSLIPYPVFVKGKNYTGHQPKLLKTPCLLKYVTHHFIDELKSLDNDVLIIPLGKGVEEVLLHLAEEKLLDKNQILRGFPHPSGANAHRLTQFKEHQQSMINHIDTWFETH